MSWLDTLFARTVQVNGSALPSRSVTNFIGVTGTDNPASLRTDITMAGGVASSGLAAARPAASGSGRIYLCTDVPVLYVDDPVSAAWLQFGLAGYRPSPGLVTDYTLVGKLALTQRGDSILATSYGTAGGAAALKAIPAALVSSGKWAIDLAAVSAHSFGAGGAGYPEISLVVSDGTVDGTSNVFCIQRLDGNSQGWLASTCNLNGTTRTTYINSTTSTCVFGYTGLHMRLLCDGTYLLFQYGGDGSFWRTLYTLPVPAGLLYYGFSVGSDITLAASQGVGALIQKLRIQAIPAQVSISAMTQVGSIITVTTSTPHGLVGGMPLTLSGIVGTGTNPGGEFDAGATVTSATQFTITQVAAFTYTSGGKVTNVGL